MLNDYKPTSGQLVTALVALGDDLKDFDLRRELEPGDYAELVGRLLARVLAAKCAVLKVEDEIRLAAAYFDQFQPDESNTEEAKRLAFECFLRAQAEAVLLITRMSNRKPFGEEHFCGLEHPLAMACSNTASVLDMLFSMRHTLSDRVGTFPIQSEESPMELFQRVGPVVKQIPVTISAISSVITMLSILMDPENYTDKQDEQEEPNGSHAELVELLTRTQASGHIKDWVLGGENVIVFRTHGEPLDMPVNAAIAYARGCLDTIDKAALDGIEQATKISES